MTQILVPSGQSKCKRCGRWFQPRSPEQEYGPTCAKKISGVIECRDQQGKITAVIV